MKTVLINTMAMITIVLGHALPNFWAAPGPRLVTAQPAERERRYHCRNLLAVFGGRRSYDSAPRRPWEQVGELVSPWVTSRNNGYIM